jgi:hypothetical protein
VLTDLIRLYTQLTMMRKSPAEVPASPVLLVLTILVCFGSQWVVGALLPPMKGPWINRLVLDVAFTLVWYALLMYLVKKPERFLQTSTAVFGYQILLMPPSIAIAGVQQGLDKESIWQYPLSWITLALFIWIVAANSHIVKAALEWSMAPSVALVILQTLVGELLALTLFQS